MEIHRLFTPTHKLLNTPHLYPNITQIKGNYVLTDLLFNIYSPHLGPTITQMKHKFCTYRLNLTKRVLLEGQKKNPSTISHPLMYSPHLGSTITQMKRNYTLSVHLAPN